MNSKGILFAIETLIHQSETSEIHGDWDAITEKLACELGGPHCDEVMKLFQQHLQTLGLENVTANSEVAFIIGMDGELNFIDRKLICTVD